MNVSTEVIVTGDTAALAELVAEHVVAAAAHAVAERGRFDLALAGGSTPKAAYDLLAGRLRTEIHWPYVRFFFSDERCVGPEDADSNYRMARDHLLGPLAIAPEAVARMRGEDDPSAAATAYAALLRERLGPELRLDLVLLGMGTDGHTASLFPGSDPYADDEALVRAPYVATVAARRLTMTPRMLNGARRIAVVTAGAAKAQALTAALDGPHDPVTVPVQTLAPRDGRLSWLVDRASTSRRPRRS